jgi:glyoxylase-like metal-dependent hydrolase (beta-lactamase superfamily II)
MDVKRIKSRGVHFTHTTFDEWDLNMYIIRGRRHDFIIDTGLGAPHTEEMRGYLSPIKSTVIINTHHHWDHIWGNGALQEKTIVAHELCREMIGSQWEQMMRKNFEYCLGDVSMALPDLVFTEEMYFPEDKVRLVYTPGHTIDSISVLDEVDGVLHAGDNVGDTLEEIVPALYCDKQYYLDTLTKYAGLDFDTCVSGHNMPLEKDIFDRIGSLL